MNPYYADESVTLYHGDCLEVLATLPDCSVDAVVTDPPYGLEFMGKEWDAPWKSSAAHAEARVRRADEMTPQWQAHSTSAGPYLAAGVNAYEAGVPFQAWCTEWATEALRVLKPGGHLVAFGGTRTWHRLACAIEDAGFEIRDNLAWLFGSGFPKSLDVSKAIDKQRDDRADIVRVTSWLARMRDSAGLTNRDLDDAFGFAGMAGHWTSTKSQPAVPTWDQWLRLKELIGYGDDMDAEVWRLNGRKGKPGDAWDEREVVGNRDVPVGHAFAGSTYGGDSSNQVVDITAPATDAARQWQGWGTALKPAHEPVVLARKPLSGTVAATVLEHGTGALNIDATRISGDEDGSRNRPPSRLGSADTYAQDEWTRTAVVQRNDTTGLGRWPANVILDADAAAMLDRQSGVSVSVAAPRGVPGIRQNGIGETVYKGGPIGEQGEVRGHNDTGGASRFFYTAKADQNERPRVNGVAHPTVKPLDLMQWLVRLVTPPGGVVLEPFAGSGTTAEACVVEGFNCIAIEREPDYLPLIVARLSKPIERTLL